MFNDNFLSSGNTTLTYELEMFDIRQPPPQADMFSHIDTNGDKKLSKKEVSAYMKAQAAAHGMPVHDKKWKKHHKTVVANIFDHEDSDEDGSISHDEFSGPKMMYHDEFQRGSLGFAIQRDTLCDSARDTKSRN